MQSERASERAREREREREGGKEGGREGGRAGGASVARVPRFPINEVYFVSKQVCAKRERERERERERRRGKHGKNSNQRGVLRLQAFKHVKSSNQRGVLRFDQRGVLRLQACQECDTLPTVESGARSTTFAECCRRPPEVRLTWGSASLDKVSTATACRDEGDGVKVPAAQGKQL